MDSPPVPLPLDSSNPLLTPYKMGNFNLSHRYMLTIDHLMYFWKLFGKAGWSKQLSYIALVHMILTFAFFPSLLPLFLHHTNYFHCFTLLPLYLQFQNCFGTTYKTEILQQYSSTPCYSLLLSENFPGRLSHSWSHWCLWHCSGVIPFHSYSLSLFMLPSCFCEFICYVHMKLYI